MSKFNELFDLIHSFSQTEKTYFKRYAKQESAKEIKLYFELFNLIDVQEREDEGAIRKQLSNKEFTCDFAATKNYLYKLLLKSLRSYHAGKTARIKIREFHINALILLDRRLNKQALKLLSKAKKLAERYHLKHELAEIILFQRKIIRTFVEKKTVNLIKKHQKEYQKNAERIKLEQEIRTHYEDIFLIARKKNTATLEMEKIFENFQTSFTETIFSEELNFEEKSIICFLRATYHSQKNNYDIVVNEYENLLLFFKENPHFKKEYQLRYISLLNNYLTVFQKAGKYEEIPPIIVQLENITPRNSQIKIVLYEMLFYAKTLHFLSQKDYKQTATFASNVWSFLKKHEQQITKTRKEGFYANFAYAFFMQGQFHESLKWLDFLLYEDESNIRPDIAIFAKTLEVLNHFELENDVFIEYQIIRMRKRYKDSALKKLVFPILKTLKAIINAPNSEEKKLLNSLYNEIKNDPQMSHIKEWLEVRKTWKNRQIFHN